MFSVLFLWEFSRRNVLFAGGGYYVTLFKNPLVETPKSSRFHFGYPEAFTIIINSSKIHVPLFIGFR